MLKIFVLEDEASDWFTIMNAFKDEEFIEAKRFANTKDALTELHSSNNYDLALLDVNIEDGTDDNGFTVAKAINQIYSIPIIFLTQHYDSEDYSDEASKLGVRAKYFLSKKTLKNKKNFLGTIEDAIEDFQYMRGPINGVEQLLLADRKIGLRKGSTDEYVFYGQDEILFLYGEGNGTEFYDVHGKRIHTYGHQIKPIAERIMKLFPNFKRLGPYCVNMTRVKHLQGRVLSLEKSDGSLHILEDIKPRGLDKLKAEGLLIKVGQ